MFGGLNLLCEITTFKFPWYVRFSFFFFLFSFLSPFNFKIFKPENYKFIFLAIFVKHFNNFIDIS